MSQVPLGAFPSPHIRTLSWRADACNPETGAAGFEAVPRKGVFKIVPGIGVNFLAAVHEALLRACAARRGDGYLREYWRGLQPDEVGIGEELWHDCACTEAELAARDVGICHLEASAADLAPGALKEDLEQACHPIGDGDFINKPEVALLCTSEAHKNPNFATLRPSSQIPAFRCQCVPCAIVE